jgi:5-methyltetrahydrofolate--homocysteine methyltransferase
MSARDLLATLGTGRILVSDGAWGTLLQRRGLGPGECPELWNAERPADVEAVARSYVEAGADTILTNSFGGNPARLAHFGLEGRCAELNKAAAAISRSAAGEDTIVLGSMGPTGAVIMAGEIEPEAAAEGFRIQASALAEGGVDGFCIETFSALDEAALAVGAARAVSSLPIACTFTFNRTPSGEYRTMMGVGPAECAQAALEAGASVIGANCGNGFLQMIDIVKELRAAFPGVPILVHANAGMPVLENGRVTYPESPEYMASLAPRLVKAGANIIGGCCGTGPEHIRAIAHALRA